MLVSEPLERQGRTAPVAIGAFVGATGEIAAALDSTGHITQVSDSFVDLTVHRAGDLLGRRFISLVHPDEVAPVNAAVFGASAGNPQLLLHRLRDSSGGYCWVETGIQRFGAADDVALLAVIRDVQERVAHEQALVRELAAVGDLFNELREGVVVIDPDGLVIAVNDAATRFLGATRDSLRGGLARAHVTVLDERGHPMAAERLPSTRAFRTGTTQHEAVQYRRRDGTSVWLFARTVPLFDPGQLSPARVAIFLEDAAPPEDAPIPRAGAVADAAHSVLTSREEEVLRLLAQGHDVSEISRLLEITVHTARGHVKQIMQKLGARTQLQAVVIALRSGLVQVH